VGAAVLSRSEAATIRGESYMRKAFTSLVFDEPNLEHLELKSKNMRKVDVCVYDNARDYCIFINLIGEA